jgi:hypothetical protein
LGERARASRGLLDVFCTLFGEPEECDISSHNYSFVELFLVQVLPEKIIQSRAALSIGSANRSIDFPATENHSVRH